MASISIALSKGRIFDETAPLLARVGIRPRSNPETSRKLVIATSRRDLRLIMVRASDTPTYVQHGGADLGIAGRDVLVEHGGEGLYQPVDLGIARCRMVVAVRKGFDYQSAVAQGARLRVATKYVNTTREHFAAKGVHVDLIRLYGSTGPGACAPRSTLWVRRSARHCARPMSAFAPSTSDSCRAPGISAKRTARGSASACDRSSASASTSRAARPLIRHRC